MEEEKKTTSRENLLGEIEMGDHEKQGEARNESAAARRFRAMLEGHGERVASVAWSPDGERIASGSDDGTVRVWSAATSEVERTLEGHDDGVESVAWSPDGERIVSGSRDSTVRVWSAATGELQRTLEGHGASVESVAWSPDGERIASGSEDHTVRVWSAATGELLHTLEGHSSDVWSVAWSPDGERIASGSGGKTVRIWSAATGELERTLEGHDNNVWSVAWSPDGERIASGSSDKTVRVWSAATGEVQRTLEGHRSIVFSVAWSPDGERIASGSEDETVRVWSAATGELHRTLEGHGGDVSSVAWSPDGERIASGLANKTVRVWSAATGEVQSTLEGHRGWVRSVAWSPDGERIASSSDDKTVRMWSAATGELQRTLEGHRSIVYSVAWSPDGERIASGSEDRTVRVWSATTGELLHTLEGHRLSVRSVAWSPDGERIASGSEDNTVRVWSAASGELQHQLEGHDNDASSVSWSPDGERIASGSNDHTVRVWSAATGELERTLEGHRNWVNSVAWSPDGERIVSGSLDKTVRVWSAATGGLQRTLKGHSSCVKSVAWSKDVERITSGSQDKTVLVWSLKDASLPPAVLAPSGTGGAFAMCLSGMAVDDGNKVVRVVPPLVDSPWECLPAWSVRLHVDAARGKSAADAAEYLAKHVPPRSWHWLPDLFVEAARDAGSAGLFQALLQQAVPEQPFPRWSAVLEAALDSRSRSTVEAVARKVVESARAHNRRLLVPGARPAWTMTHSHKDDGMAAQLARLSQQFPAVARDLLRDLPLLASGMDVSHGFGGKAALGASGLLTRPEESVAPAGLWRREVDEGDAEGDDAGLVDAGVVAFPGLAGGGDKNGDALLDSLLRTDDAEMFGGPTTRALLEHKWKSYGRALFVREMLVYAAGLLLVTALGLLVDDYSLDARQRWSAARDDSDSRQIAILAVGLAVAAAALRDLWREATQVALDGWAAYRADPWNGLDALLVALSGAALGLLAAGRSGGALALSVLVLLKWFGLLFYLQPWRQTGPLVSMILHIVADMRWFLVVLGVAVLGVGFSFLVLLGDEEASEGFGDPADALFTMFRMLLLSDFDVETLAVGEYASAVRLMFVAAMLLVPIVLLNLLIALMSDSYERIQNRAEVEFQLLRARVVHEMELFMRGGARRDPALFPRHVHALVPEGSVLNPAAGGAQQWQGVLHALKAEAAASRRAADVKYAALDAKIEAVSAKVEAANTKMEARIGDLDAKLDRILAVFSRGADDRSEDDAKSERE